MIFRFSDPNNFWWFYNSGSKYTLEKVVDGNSTIVKNFSQSIASPKDGDRLAADFSDNLITVKVNDSSDLVEPIYTDEAHRYNVLHGFGCRVGNAYARFDNFAFLVIDSK